VNNSKKKLVRKERTTAPLYGRSDVNIRILGLTPCTGVNIRILGLTPVSTITQREGRWIEGFSMEGYGAGHLGFKYPELFGVVSCICSAAMGYDFWVGYGGGEPLKIIFGSRERFEANHPFTLAEKNAEMLRTKTLVRIMTSQHDTALKPSRELHDLLDGLRIPHTYMEAPGVGHDYKAVYETLGYDKTLPLFQKAFEQLRNVSKK